MHKTRHVIGTGAECAQAMQEALENDCRIDQFALGEAVSMMGVKTEFAGQVLTIIEHGEKIVIVYNGEVILD